MSSIFTSGSLTQEINGIIRFTPSDNTPSYILQFTNGVSISSPHITLTLSNNITFISPQQYFIIDSDAITIQGNHHTILIYDAIDYPGVFKSTLNALQTTIHNIGISPIRSTLVKFSAWLLQHTPHTLNNTTVYNSFSTGEVPSNCGGIFPYASAGTANNCYSTGIIFGGGIFAPHSTGTAYNCYSTGIINAGGGIFGDASTGTANDSYSTGDVFTNAGAIFGSASTGTANFSYSTGKIKGLFAGGIFGSLSTGNAYNCYSTATITGFGGTIFGSSSTGNAYNCYSIGHHNTGGLIQSNCLSTDTWLDDSANLTIGKQHTSKWITISTNTPWLLASFTAPIYNPSSFTTSSNFISSSDGLFGTNTAYTGTFISPTYVILNTTHLTPTIHSTTGRLSFTNPTGISIVSVLCYYLFNHNPVGYNIGTFTLTSHTATVPCFLVGTIIQTNVDQYKFIQDLKEGENIYTPDGRFVPILKIDHYTCLSNSDNAPYKVPSGYKLSHHVCTQDLFLSQEHGILFDPEVIVPVRNLGFHQDTTIQRLHYFHITLPNFFTDNLLANGIPCESYCGYFIKQSNYQMHLLPFMLELLKKVYCKKTFARRFLTTTAYQSLLSAFLRLNPV